MIKQMDPLKFCVVPICGHADEYVGGPGGMPLDIFGARDQIHGSADIKLSDRSTEHPSALIYSASDDHHAPDLWTGVT